MYREFAEIIENRQIGHDLYFMKIRSEPIASAWIPGQFLHLLPPIIGDRPPMLRRPISIMASDRSDIELVYRVVGDGTVLLAQMKPGETIDTIGPLGTGFVNIPSEEGRHVLIGGGVGAPPMIALARYLHSKDYQTELYLGAKSTDELIFHEKLQNEGFVYCASTEDGSTGFTGLVTQNLPDASRDIACAYACGPVPMMKSVLKWRGNNSFPVYVSLENKMGCGVGVCLGCSIPTVDGKYIRTCKDGPVFNADIIDWERMNN